MRLDHEATLRRFCPLALRSSPGTEHPFRHLELCCFLGWFHSASYQQHAVLIVSLEKWEDDINDFLKQVLEEKEKENEKPVERSSQTNKNWINIAKDWRRWALLEGNYTMTV